MEDGSDSDGAPQQGGAGPQSGPQPGAWCGAQHPLPRQGAQWAAATAALGASTDWRQARGARTCEDTGEGAQRRPAEPVQARGQAPRTGERVWTKAGPRAGRILERVPTHTAALRPDSDGGRRAHCPAGPDPAQIPGRRHKDRVQALGTGHHAVIREGRHIQSSDSDGGQRPQSQERAGARLDPTGRAARANGGRSTESTTRRTRPVSSVSGDQHRPRRWPGVTGLFGHVH